MGMAVHPRRRRVTSRTRTGLDRRQPPVAWTEAVLGVPTGHFLRKQAELERKDE